MTRIVYFPEPFPNESIYSLIARYKEHYSLTSTGTIMKQLFGNAHKVQDIDFPTDLNGLSERLGKDASYSSYLIEHHSPIPFLRPFLDNERVISVANKMISSSGIGVRKVAGFIGQSFTHQGLYFCPQCSMEHFEECGESYWQVKHQMLGYTICTKHHQLLFRVDFNGNLLPFQGDLFERVPLSNHSNSVIKKTGRNINYILPEKDTVMESYKAICNSTLSKNDFNHLIKIAKEIEWLFENQPPILGFSRLKEVYRCKLQSKGYIYANSSNLHKQKFQTDFYSYYPIDVLRILQSETPKSGIWLDFIFSYGRNFTIPVRHILFILFLWNSLSVFFKEAAILTKEMKEKDKQRNFLSPFGTGPWYCLNPICDHYLSKSIDEIKITINYTLGISVGTFKCGCDYTYSIRADEWTSENSYLPSTIKVNKVIQKGEKWLGYVHELYNIGYNLRDISLKLHVSEHTIRRALKKQTPNNTFKKASIAKRKEYRALLLKMINEHPEWTRTNLYNELRTAYNWLYKNDRDWFENSAPPKNCNTTHGPTVDWEERDINLLNKLKRIKAEWGKLEKDKPLRLTKNVLIKRLKFMEIHSFEEGKYPRSARYLESIIEETHDFHIRKIEWALGKFFSHKIVTKNQLYKKTRLGYDNTAYLTPYILTKIEEHNNTIY